MHTTSNCYWPGGGKEGQFPPNFGQRTWANAANTLPMTEHFVLLAHISNTPGQSGVLIDIPIHQSSMALISQGFQMFQKGKVPTFMDSRASDTMFISRDVFTEYKSIALCLGDSAKTENSSFEIIGEGNVTQRYQVDGKEHNITYTCALHAPMLNANLISVSLLDKMGLTTTFGDGKGVTTKADGTIVLLSQNINRMYLLDVVVTLPDTLLAMASLS